MNGDCMTGRNIVQTTFAEMHPHPWRAEMGRTYRRAAGDETGRSVVEEVYGNILDRDGHVVAWRLHPKQARMVVAAANDYADKWVWG